MVFLIILLFVLLLGVIAFLVWKAFIRDGREALKRSESRVAELEGQVALLREKASTRLNVTGLSPILHVALLNVDTSFVRPYTREEDGFVFNGALRADITAEYGVRLEDMKFRQDGDTLYVSGFRPGLISFSRKQLAWQHAAAVRKRRLLPAVSDASAELFAKKMKERLREELEREIDSRKIEELQWLSPVVSAQVEELLRQIAGRPGMRILDVGDSPAEGYVSFDDFLITT